MISKIPIIGSAATVNDLSYAFRHSKDGSVSQEFSLALSKLMHARYIYLTNSGISSFYIILKALKGKSKNIEIILPAYTAGSLVVAVIKAGLKPVLCDISLKDFNLDKDHLLKAISSNTLAVVLVHMFGIGISGIPEIRNKIPSSVFLIEDCAQAMASRIGQGKAGSFSDISFFSFNRGKNLPTFEGGCISTNSEDLAGSLNLVYKNEARGYKLLDIVILVLKALAFSFATRPLVYGFGYPLISLFKEVSPAKDFSVRKNCPFQAGLGLALLKKIEEISQARYKKGIFLINALSKFNELITPEIPQDIQPVFNRIPIVFKDIRIKERVERRLWAHGIETSSMYLKPLHHMFNLGYKGEDFPNANYISEHLLVLPVHRFVKDKELLKMVEIIAGVMKR